MLRPMRCFSLLWLPLLLSFGLSAICLVPGLSATEEDSAAEVHPSGEALKKELTAVVDAQLAALRADDYAKAYTFAADGIKEVYGAKDFETMVRSAYPVIAKSTGADYGAAFDHGDDALVNVRVVNSDDKRSVQYRYLLHKENGAWKIAGVTEVKPAGISV